MTWVNVHEESNICCSLYIYKTTVRGEIQNFLSTETNVDIVSFYVRDYFDYFFSDYFVEQSVKVFSSNGNTLFSQQLKLANEKTTQVNSRRNPYRTRFSSSVFTNKGYISATVLSRLVILVGTDTSTFTSHHLELERQVKN